MQLENLGLICNIDKTTRFISQHSVTNSRSVQIKDCRFSPQCNRLSETSVRRPTICQFSRSWAREEKDERNHSPFSPIFHKPEEKSPLTDDEERSDQIYHHNLFLSLNSIDSIFLRLQANSPTCYVFTHLHFGSGLSPDEETKNGFFFWFLIQSGWICWEKKI